MILTEKDSTYVLSDVDDRDELRANHLLPDRGPDFHRAVGAGLLPVDVSKSWKSSYSLAIIRSAASFIS